MMYSWLNARLRLFFLRATLIIAFLSFQNELFTQDTANTEGINSNSNREEIQRYFGFEDELFRYTTQPYDLSMNINQTANFLDIGPLYFLFFPLLFVLLLLKGKKARIFGFMGLIFYLFSCLYFSLIITSSSQFITSEQIRQGDFLNEDFSTSAKLLLPVYEFANTLFHPVFQFISNNIHTNVITYPLVFLIFTGILFICTGINERKLKTISIIYLGFSLLFFLLSAGILWYGFLLLPISLLILYIGVKKIRYSGIEGILEKCFYSLLGLTLMAFLFLRISNIQPSDPAGEKGKNLFYANIFSFSNGSSDEGESLDLVFPGMSTTLKEINNNDDLIYKVGTSFSIHIDNNNERVYSDNQLSTFYNLLQNYESSSDVFKALKAYGFSYLLLDLHTASIDKTPDKSLTRKYRLLLESIYNSPNLTLINTDRRVQISSGDEVKTMNALFGQVEYFGNYAVYRL